MNALDDAGKEIKTELNASLAGNALLLDRWVTEIIPDNASSSINGYSNWVGFGDATDYRMFTLENTVNLTLNISATGKAKLAIWKVSTNAKTGAISLASKGAATAKAGKDGVVKAKVLEAGDYFISVTATDAAKGGDVSYNLEVGAQSIFFDSADNGRNNELYDKKAKAFYGEDDDHHFVTTSLSDGSKSVRLDTGVMGDDSYGNFVGCGDKTDYAKIVLTETGNLSFDLKTTGDATFTVYRKGQDKKGNNTLDAIQTTKLKLAKNTSVVVTTTNVIANLEAGEYYISMTAANTKANEKGCVFYNVTANLDVYYEDSLAMPEADSLAMTDALSFGGFDADALADASASALAELDSKAAWLNIASLA